MNKESSSSLSQLKSWSTPRSLSCVASNISILTTKWNTPKRDGRVGDIVSLEDNDLPKNYWPPACVTKAFPSKDGRIRKECISEIKFSRPEIT